MIVPYIVYIHINTKTDNIYVGITKYSNPIRRWGSNGKRKTAYGYKWGYK